jgi:translation elongation factor EF-1beta
VSLGIGHGFVRRISTTEVEVLVVLPDDPRIDLNRIAVYFGLKWNVVAEDYRVDQNNTQHINFLNTDLKVYKSTIPDPEGRSLDEDLDLVSTDGFSVISDSVLLTF